jgi:hypothetical protein
MRPYQPGENLYNLIKTAIPNFVEAEYPAFVEFVATFVRFLESQRTFGTKTVYPEYGTVANSTVSTTAEFGGPLYEARKLLEYRDTAQTLEDFKSHFLAMFANAFPQFSYLPLDIFVQSLRQFYQGKTTVETVQWFFRALFNEHADVYYPREDILKPSDATWSAPVTIKVSAPTDGHNNGDVTTYYVGQRIQTPTGSAQVEAVVSNIVGQAFNQNIIVNELTLKFDTILGFFSPGQTVVNIDSAQTVHTTVLSVITDVVVLSGGSNYAIGDSVLFSEGPAGGGGYQAFGLVGQVSNTAINGITVLTGGNGFLTGLPLTFISTTGHGAKGVVTEVVYGEYALEDGSGYLSVEQQDSGITNRLTLEDKNTIDLQFSIFDFVNANANVFFATDDYGLATGIAELVGVNYDSPIEDVLIALDVRPFMHPWVFLDNLHTNAALANAAVICNVVGTTFFGSNANVFALTSLTDITSNVANSTITARAIISDTTDATANNDTLYLVDFNSNTGMSLLINGTVFKEAGNGYSQSGTLTTDGTINVLGTNTAFTAVLVPNAHVRLGSGAHAIVSAVVNDTFFVATTLIAAVSANTWSIVPVGTVTDITLQQQRYYGKIKKVQLLSRGAGYKTPPAVTVDSISARAQELFHLEPDPLNPLDVHSANNTIVVSNGIVLFADASLVVQQDAGQIQKVKIVNSGVHYTDANSIVITAVHGAPRTGENADLQPVLGALTRYPGQFTTSRSFLSADKYLQDDAFYNDYTYVVRVAESFDRYRNLLLRLMHPAGFKPLGEFVDEIVTPFAISVPVHDNPETEAQVVSFSPSSSPSASPSASHSPSASKSPSASVSPSASKSPSASVSPSASASPSATPPAPPESLLFAGGYDSDLFVSPPNGVIRAISNTATLLGDGILQTPPPIGRNDLFVMVASDEATLIVGDCQTPFSLKMNVAVLSANVPLTIIGSFTANVGGSNTGNAVMSSMTANAHFYLAKRNETPNYTIRTVPDPQSLLGPTANVGYANVEIAGSDAGGFPAGEYQFGLMFITQYGYSANGGIDTSGTDRRFFGHSGVANNSGSTLTLTSASLLHVKFEMPTPSFVPVSYSDVIAVYSKDGGPWTFLIDYSSFGGLATGARAYDGMLPHSYVSYGGGIGPGGPGRITGISGVLLLNAAQSEASGNNYFNAWAAGFTAPFTLPDVNDTTLAAYHQTILDAHYTANGLFISNTALGWNQKWFNEISLTSDGAYAYMCGWDEDGANTTDSLYRFTFANTTSEVIYTTPANTYMDDSYGSRIVALSNHEVLVLWTKYDNTGYVARHAANGSIITTYALTGYPHRLVPGANDETFWVSTNDNAANTSWDERVYQFRTSNGQILVNITPGNNDTDFYQYDAPFVLSKFDMHLDT